MNISTWGTPTVEHERPGHNASRALSKELGINVEYQDIDCEEGRLIISPMYGGSVIELRCFTLLHLRPTHIEHVEARLRSMSGEAVLITYYANPSIKTLLMERGINFVDIWGNFYLKGHNFFFSHSGLKPKSVENGTTNKAFDLAGMKLILALLSQQVPIGASYRDLAKASGISLGAVGTALEGLERAGFMMFSKEPGRRTISNRKKLLDRWVNSYTEKIKPKLLIGIYESSMLESWRNMPVYEYFAHWGGEPAGSLLTNYLNPALFTLYIEKMNVAKLISKARLKKHEGELNQYWDNQFVEVYQTIGQKYSDPIGDYPLDVVNPIIVYADLLGSKDSRNNEVAEAVYEQRIHRLIGKD